MNTSSLCLHAQSMLTKSIFWVSEIFLRRYRYVAWSGSVSNFKDDSPIPTNVHQFFPVFILSKFE